MRLDKSNQKNENIYVYTTIVELPSVVLYPEFAFLYVFVTESASLPSLINWVQCHVFYIYYFNSGNTQIEKRKFDKEQRIEFNSKRKLKKKKKMKSKHTKGGSSRQEVFCEKGVLRNIW